jgi:hypothetical protein
MFTEGIATRLGQYLDRIDVQVIDSRGPNCLTKVGEAHPAVIVVEANDENLDMLCPLDQLLGAAPEVKIIRLDPDLDQIHVVTGELKTLQRPGDLINMLLPPTTGGGAGLE